jgi:Sporulation and spore germination
MRLLRVMLVGGLAFGLGALGFNATAAARDGGLGVQVFFSRHPESDADFTAVFPVPRTAPDPGVARFALESLIAGPTPAEQAAGYFSGLGGMLSGPSTCGGADFTIAVHDGLATVRFCRLVTSAGIGQDARVTSQIRATLTQFSAIQRVRLLTSDNHCLFDQSGLDLCLRG